MDEGGEATSSKESGFENILRRRRRELSDLEERDLPDRWRAVLRSYKSFEDEQQTHTDYPRWRRLFDIVREDGRIRLMLGYDKENPTPDFADPGQRRQVEAMLGFEKPLERLMTEAQNRWLAEDFEGEATLLEEFANSNPQRDAILDLAAEARRDALTGASSRQRPRRRESR